MRLSSVARLRRPPELLYAADETPPPGTWLALAAQHACTALALTAYALVAANLGGLHGDAARSFIAVTILVMGLATLLQSWGGRLGSASLLVHIPAPALIVFTGAALAAHGAGGVFLLGLTAGVVALLVSLVVDRLRSVFPPTVAGTVICLVGLSLVPGALRNASGLAGPAGPGVHGVQVLLSLTTLAVIVAAVVWGGRRASVFGIALGVAVGTALAAVLGAVHGVSALTHAPLLALPALPVPVFAIDPVLLLSVALAVTLGQLDVFGSAVMMQKMDDAGWRRVDMPRAARSLRPGGIANVAGACLGAHPIGLSSANIGLCHATRCTSRMVGLGVGACLIVVAFLPQVTLALTLIPSAVLGGVQIYAAGYLLVSGMQLVVSRALDVRAYFTVGFSLLTGAALMSAPLLGKQGPLWLQHITASGFVAGGLVAVFGNLLTRIGVSSRAVLPWAEAGGQPTDWILECGARWGARRDVLQRVAQAALEAVEWLAASGRSPRELVFVFDEFRLTLTIRHDGAPLALPPAGGGRGALDAAVLDDEQALELALAAVPAALLARLADRAQAREGRRGAELQLVFEH